MVWTTLTRGLVAGWLVVGAGLVVLPLSGCATPRWVTASDDQPGDAINGKVVKRVVVTAVIAAADYEAGMRPYEVLLPRGATPETYAEVSYRLGPDARIPEGIPAVEVDEKGHAVKRAKEVLEAEKLNLPQAAPAGLLPLYEVRSVRLRGQTGEVDVVRPLRSFRRLLTVSLDLDPGYGWQVVGVRQWTLDPDTER